MGLCDRQAHILTGMVITPIPHGLTLLTPPRPNPFPRTPGLHVSTILRRVALRLGVFRAADDEEGLDARIFENASDADRDSLFDETARCRMAMGLGWERWLARLLPHVQFHPGVQSRALPNGLIVWGSPDGLEQRTGSAGEDIWVLHEFKLTWKSCGPKFNVEKQWYWLHQMRAYTGMLMELLGRDVRVLGELWVYFVCGDYRPPCNPQFKRWAVEFTREECDATWKTIAGEVERSLG